MADNLSITVKQAEAKTVTVTYDSGNTDVSSGTFTFTLRTTGDTSDLFTVADASFDKTNGASGIVTFPLSATNTNQTPGFYTGEIKVVLTASNIDKSDDIKFTIEKATT